MDERERIFRTVAEAAGELSDLHSAHERLWRRREFLAELRERGNWLAGNTRAATPDWVKPWNEYFEQLRTDPENLRLQSATAAARERLHSPEFESAIENLQLGQGGSNADWAIAYIAADPWYFRSGYFKSRLARWLRQVELSAEQKADARAAMLAALRKGSRFEQAEYRKLARRVETPEFREQLRALAAAKDEGLARRAGLMLRSCELNDTPGRDLRGAR
jgi:hypothetical protein